MTQVERKFERVLKTRLLSQNNASHLPIENENLTKKSLPKIIVKLPLNLLQKKQFFRKPSQKIFTEGDNQLCMRELPLQNQQPEILPVESFQEKDKNIKIFKRRVKKSNKNHHTESDLYSQNLGKEQIRQYSVGTSNSNELHFLPSTDESNHTSSQKKRDNTHQKVLSLKSFNNKIIPLYRGVEDIVAADEQGGVSPKKSLSSSSILQQKIQPRGLINSEQQQQQWNSKNPIPQIKLDQLSEFKQSPLSKRYKKDYRVQSESRKFKNLNDLITLEFTGDKSQKIKESETSIQDYIFFKEGKILQDYENFKKMELQQENVLGNLIGRISPILNPSAQNQLQSNKNHQLNKAVTARNGSTESLKSHLKIGRIQGTLLKERRLSMLQDYKSVDFKDLTSSSSSSSSTSSLCTLKNTHHHNNDSSPVKDLYNISPEKKSAKCLANKIMPQNYQRNVYGIKNKLESDMLQIRSGNSPLPHNENIIIPQKSQSTKNQRNDQNLQFFLKSQKKLIRNVNTNKSPSNNIISSSFNKKNNYLASKLDTNIDDKYDYDVQN